jgi:ferredoxin
MGAGWWKAGHYHGPMQEQGAVPPVYEAVLQASGRRFPARADRPLLQSAAEAGFALASSCRNGTCRACLRPLHSGQVRYRIAWPGLLPEEKASGAWVLPCVAFPESDVVLGDAASP